MIPKIIHYCWFGGNPLDEKSKRCIESWEKFCPDFTIKEWNENNFNVNTCQYVKEAYDAKKWAFVTDYVRLYALNNEGGIYMDTDVEVVKPIDCLLKYSTVSGFEASDRIPTGLIGSEPNSPIIKTLLNEYESIHFIEEDGTLNQTTNVERITKTLLKYGLQQNNKMQTVNGFTLLPSDYLCPKDLLTGEIHLTNNSLVIHHFSGSWVSKKSRLRSRIYQLIAKHFGKQTADYARKIFGTHK